MSVPVICALIPELTRDGCRMCGFEGLGFKEGGGEGAERGTSVRRPRSRAVLSSERAVGNSAVDGPLSLSSSCIVCVCMRVDDAYVCMCACMSCTNKYTSMYVFAYLCIRTNENAARAHSHTPHAHTFSAPYPHTHPQTRTHAIMLRTPVLYYTFHLY